MPRYQIEVDNSTYEIDSDHELSDSEVMDYANNIRSQESSNVQNNISDNLKSVVKPQPKPKQSNVSKNIFPGATEAKTGLGKAFNGALDLLTILQRAGGTVRKNPETGSNYKMSDQNSYFFRPEVEKINKTIPDNTKNVIDLVNGTQYEIPDIEAQGAKKVYEFLGQQASDPLTFLDITGKMLSKPIRAVAKGADKFLGKHLSSLSGVSEDALRQYGLGGKGAQEIQKYSGEKARQEIGKDLLEKIQNIEQYMPESETVKDALNNMSPMGFDNVYKTMKNVKEPVLGPEALAANNALDDLAQMYKDYAVKPVRKVNDLQETNPLFQVVDKYKNGKPKWAYTGVSPNEFTEARKQLDRRLESAWNTDPGVASILDKQLKQVRHTMKEDLINNASKSGNSKYIPAMEQWADKIEKSNSLKRSLGKNEETRLANIESKIKRVGGKGSNQDLKEKLQDFADIVGTDYIKPARLASMAAEFGEGGKAGFISEHKTGKSLYGFIPGITMIEEGIRTGKPELVAAGLALMGVSTPKGAATTLGLTEAAGKGYNKASGLAKNSTKLKGLQGNAQVLQTNLNNKEEYK